MSDGWVFCRQGHRHWGKAGAAGLLIHRAAGRGLEVLLQKRSPSVQHGGTWGVPGGAVEFGEAASAGALREAGEEFGIRPDDVILGERYVDQHGGWSYTTVLAIPAGPLEVGNLRLNGESAAAAWVPVRALAGLALHPGLAVSMPQLLRLLRRWHNAAA